MFVRTLLALGWLVLVWLRWPAPALVGSPEGLVEVTGVVEALTCEGPRRCRVVLRDARLDAVAVAEWVAVRATQDEIGAAWLDDEVQVATLLYGERSGSNPGFEPPAAARRHRWRGKARGPVFVNAIGGPSARRSLVRRLRLPSAEVTHLYRALLLGERAGLQPAMRDAFVDSGTAHLLAISGLHLAVIGWGLYRLLLWILLCTPARWLRRLPAAAAGAACSLIWIYVAVIASGQATRRAAVALTVVMAGELLARRASGRRTLVVAALVLVAWEPEAVLGPSFQLSFAAAASLVLGWPTTQRLLAWLAEPGRLPTPLWTRLVCLLVAGLATSLLTTVATAPLTLAWFGQLSPLGVLVNLVAVPLVSLWIVPVGFAWLSCAVMSPELGAALAWVPQLSGGLLLDLVEAWSQAMGPSTAPAWPHWAGAAGAVSVLALLMRPRAGLASLAMLAAVLILQARHPTQLVFTALDVGHGDALLVELPEGQTVLIDTGGRIGRSSASLARRRLVPALTRRGIARLDLLVITHADADHVGAAAALLARVPVAEVWLPWCSAEADVIERLARAAGAAGARVRQVHRGRPFRWGGAHWRPLWPTRDTRRSDGACDDGRNHGSLALALSWRGRSVLLTGDIDAAAEAQLLRLDGGALRTDILKVAHHGSRTSTSPAFLEASDPAVALVSGVPRAGPMPPHLSVLTRLHRRGVQTWITGRDGAITVRIGDDGSLTVEPRFGSGGGLGPRSLADPAAPTIRRRGSRSLSRPRLRRPP